MNKYNLLKTERLTSTDADQYIQDALNYVTDFQSNHNGVLSQNYFEIINDYYANADRITYLLNQMNIKIDFHQSAATFYKIIDNNNDPMNLESISKNNIQIIPADQNDKQFIFKIINNMVEEYLDEIDSVHL